MPVITLPDGTQKTFEQPVSVYDVAMSIGEGLAKAALAGKVGDEMVDTSYTIDTDSTLAIITSKNDEGLEVLRHSTAHLLAQAVKRLFPQAQVTIGPVIENGFYYDFAFGRPFTPEDLSDIEKMMAKIAKENFPVTRQEMSRDEAIKFFSDQGEIYKARIIEDIPQDQTLSLYTQGEFTDLCRGPHVPSTGKLKAFKLTKVSGAYWRGDSSNEMLQRVYGTAWADKKALKAYLTRLEEAEKRDHRKIAKQMDLYHMQEEAPGMVFWHDNGYKIYQTIQKYVREKLIEGDYQEVNTPIMADRVLWEKSGHWEMFKDEMFITESENRTYAVKPMNCPCHVQIFNQGLKSYRDLPIRLSEFGSCHRNEPSGSLHGLLRVRNFVQDDAHVFCAEEDVQSESGKIIRLVKEFYRDFGFDEIIIKLATRPDKRLGSDELWDRAEGALAEALRDEDMTWEVSPGEGAFYGPKIEFSLKDCLERVWQLGTLQIDYSMPGRLGAEYVDQNGKKQVPVMLHRAIIGTFERFMGILIEHYAGKLPVWLMPKQAVVLNISEAQGQYSQKVAKILKKQSIRAHLDLRNEKIGYKIREHTLQRTPYLIVIGDREVETETVSVRHQDGRDLGNHSIEGLISLIQEDIAKLGQTSVEELTD